MQDLCEVFGLRLVFSRQYHEFDWKTTKMKISLFNIESELKFAHTKERFILLC